MVMCNFFSQKKQCNGVTCKQSNAGHNKEDKQHEVHWDKWHLKSCKEYGKWKILWPLCEKRDKQLFQTINKTACFLSNVTYTLVYMQQITVEDHTSAWFVSNILSIATGEVIKSEGPMEVWASSALRLVLSPSLPTHSLEKGWLCTIQITCKKIQFT